MQEVIEAIENIIEFIEVIFQFIGNIFRSLILALGYLIELIPKIMVIIGTLPSWLITFATISVGVSVAYFIIGRETGKSD